MTDSFSFCWTTLWENTIRFDKKKNEISYAVTGCSGHGRSISNDIGKLSPSRNGVTFNGFFSTWLTKFVFSSTIRLGKDNELKTNRKNVYIAIKRWNFLIEIWDSRTTCKHTWRWTRVNPFYKFACGFPPRTKYNCVFVCGDANEYNTCGMQCSRRRSRKCTPTIRDG